MKTSFQSIQAKSQVEFILNLFQGLVKRKNKGSELNSELTCPEGFAKEKR